MTTKENKSVGDEATFSRNMSLNHISNLDKMNKFNIQNFITFEEKVNIDYLKKILSDYDENYELLGRFKDHKNGFKQIIDKSTIKTIIEKRLKHGNIFSYKSDGFRLIPNGFSCCMMNKVLRHTIAGENNIDIDIDNCHPVILSWYCKIKNWSCENLNNYINNRETFLNDVMVYYEIDRGSAKTKILSLLNNENDGFNVESPLFNLYNEIKFLHDFISIDRKDLLKKAKQRKNGFNNPKGVCMSLFLQEIENKICQCMIKYCQIHDIHITSPCYDGLLISYKDDVNQLLTNLQNYIFETLDIKINLSQKIMDKDIRGLLNEKKNNNNIIDDDEKFYDYIKFEFEKTHFKCISSGTYYEINKNKNIYIRSKTDLINSYEHMVYYEIDKKRLIEKNFINNWIKDPKIRKYEFVDLYPPPLVCPNNNFNLWNGFEIEDTIIDDDDRIKLNDKFNKLLGHFELVLGDKENPNVFKYCLDYISFMIQKPGLKPNVSILIKSKQGLGKNIISNIFNLMLGSSYCYCVHNIEQHVFGQFNPFCEGKIFYTFDEMNIKVSSALDEKIKEFITGDTISINQKGLKTKSVKNFNHTFIFSNRDFPIKVDDNDRRLFCIDQGNKNIPSHEYFVEIFDIIKNKKIIRMLFDYFIDRDVTDFDAKTNRPETSFGNDLKILSRPLEINFIIEFFENTNVSSILSSDLYTEFINWLNENTTCADKYNTSHISFGMKIANMEIDTFTKRRKKINGKTCLIYNFDIIKVKQWLIDNKYSIEFDDDDEEHIRLL